MDLSETQYTEIKKEPPISKTQNKPLTNYLSPIDEFYSTSIVFPVSATRVPLYAPTVDAEVQGYPLPITPAGVKDIQNDSYVDLTNYKMNYPGDGSLVDLNTILEQLRKENYPIGVPKGGRAIYEGFSDYTEESLLYDHDSGVSRLFIGSLSVVGLLILYRLLKL
jgi:hypothetical protein